MAIKGRKRACKNWLDLTVGLVKVIQFLGIRDRNPGCTATYWTVRCICGKEFEAGAHLLSRGMPDGCGCDLALKTKQFQKHTAKGDGCWEWQGSKDKKGYGRVHLRRGVKINAHRLSWEINKGLIPDGLWVLHHCDNPICVRPDHLFLGTHQDNMDDMKAKERRVGEKHSGAKLSNNEAREIYIKMEAKRQSSLSLARDYGVSRRCINNIADGVSWKKITADLRKEKP